MKRRTGRSPLLAGRGAITWVTAVLLLALASGAYLAWVWGPIYVVHYEVSQVVQDYMNQAVKNRDDAELLDKMCQKLRALDKVDRVGPDGRVERVPAVEVSPGDVSWERDTSSTQRTLRVRFEYTRTIEYPWIGQTVEKTFEIERASDLTVPDWGPSR
jgi:hypothetical protein